VLILSSIFLFTFLLFINLISASSFGYNTLPSKITNSNIYVVNGTNGQDGTNGINGLNGLNGTNGTNGISFSNFSLYMTGDNFTLQNTSMDNFVHWTNNTLYQILMNGSFFNTAGGGVTWAEVMNGSVMHPNDWNATNTSYRTTDNNTFLGYVSIGTNNSIGVLHVDGGFDNNTINGNVTELGGYICNGLISFGTRQNLLIQTEVFGTSWVSSGITIITNSEYSPAYTQTAEVLNSTTTTANIGQTTINKTNSTSWTFSVWMKSQSIDTALVGLEVNSSASSGIIKNVTIGRNWERYSVTQNITNAGVGIGVNIYTYGNNISVWGSQLEIGNMRCYSGALTTTNQSAFVTTSLIRSALTLTGTLTASSISTGGSCGCTGVAVGGALSGASTGAFSGAVSMAGLTASTGIFTGQVSNNIANTQWGNSTGILLTNPTPANGTAMRYWVQNPPSIYFNGTASNGTANFSVISGYQIYMNITNGTNPTNALIFTTINQTGASITYNERLRLNNSGLTINSTNVGITGKYMISSTCAVTYTGGIVTATNCTITT